MFAQRGIQGATSRELTEAAQQRNTSAISYHFGSREGLLTELLTRRGGPIDEERGRLRAELGVDPSAVDLLRCLVAPYAAQVDTEGGRAYLRIVAQLRGRFAAWRVESDVRTTKNLAAILDELESGPSAPAAIRRERLVAMIMLLTSSCAERARNIEEGNTTELDHESFVDNLVLMCAAVLRADEA